MAWKHYKRKFLWTSLAGILAIAISCFVLLMRYDSRFGKASFHRIKEGMTESKVEGILGCRAGDYRPPIWKKPTWFVSTTDVAAWPIEKSGMDFCELTNLQEKDLQEWIQDGL